MKDTSILELEEEMEQLRGKLNAFVKGDTTLLLDKETYRISTELDKLIIRWMKNQQLKRSS